MLIQAALNGGTTRADHQRVPLSPAELASEARDVLRAGAGALHLHPRDPSGEQTLEPEHVLAAVAAVRAASGLPVGVTTGIWTVDGNVQRRLELVAGWTGPDRPDYASINMNEPGTGELADLLTSLGIGIEAGVWSAEDARLLAASGFRDRILRVLMEPTDRVPAGAVAAAAAAAAELARHGDHGPPGTSRVRPGHLGRAARRDRGRAGHQGRPGGHAGPARRRGRRGER